MTEEQEALVKTSVSLPRYLYDWLVDRVNKKEFNSQSSAMVVALSQLKGEMDYIDAKKKGSSELELLLEAYLQTDEGRAIRDNIKKKELNTRKQPAKNNDGVTLFADEWEREDILE